MKAAAKAPVSAKVAAKKAAPPKAPQKAAPKKAAPLKAAPPKAAKKMAAAMKAAAKKTAAPMKAAAKAAAKQAGSAKGGVAKAAPKKAASGKAASGKAAAAKAGPAKSMAVTKAAPRRIPAKIPAPATRRLRATAVKRIASVPKRPAAPSPAAPAARPPQHFTVSHLHEDDFKRDGLRPYALYRDLGIAAATAGLCQAHVIRFIPPTTDEVRKQHTHTVDLQLVYVLKGWIKNEFEGHGPQMMSTGSCWLQPSGIKHTVLEYSADCEVLEIIVPADFETSETS
ncbi:cupin domain-containing protein [Rhodopila sp.]|uniref:cupin domain-containing protein n=1 Tax=Rhodopila sp. TaxID=2480087 RepID=UPI002C67C882|nr:cupin domain-containing protein [Rhodopila sp.]HVZ09200.1 cupin domain-containing protein [Rhodopila sp.]